MDDKAIVAAIGELTKATREVSGKLEELRRALVYNEHLDFESLAQGVWGAAEMVTQALEDK